jgi:hypothetical protein
MIFTYQRLIIRIFFISSHSHSENECTDILLDRLLNTTLKPKSNYTLLSARPYGAGIPIYV